MQTQQEQNNFSDILKILLRDKKQAENSLENIVNATESGITNSTMQNRMKNLESKIEELEKQILVEKCKTVTILTEEEIRKYYIEALKLDNEMLINYTIKQIKLYDDKIEIQFNSPLRKGSNNELSFYIGTKKIGYIIQNKPTLQYKDMIVILFV